MSSNVIIILLLIFSGLFGYITNTLRTDYFNRNVWFNNGNIFHIEQEHFWTAFQQHRNVNRHIDWVTNEISSLNRQIKLVKDEINFIAHPRKYRLILQQKKPDIPDQTSLPIKNHTQTNLPPPSSITIIKNQRNIHIIKLLSSESLFDGYREDLIDIYELSVTGTIECIAVIIEEYSMEKYLFIKLSNGTIDTYRMNKTKSLKETYWLLDQPLAIWNSIGKQLEYYRRFLSDDKINEVIMTNQLIKIKNRPRSNDHHFFDTMGQILRVKYHIDSSSLSCILETFFDNIYTCDGRLVHPHELKLLSNDKNLFIFYAIMMDTTVEKQIYPLDINNHIRHGDQLFFLFTTHPQFTSLSTLPCVDCVRNEQTFVFDSNNNPEQLEQHIDSVTPEPKQTIPTEENVLNNNIQNFIVYAIVTSISLYVLFCIYLTRKDGSMNYSIKKHSVSSRRGRY